MSALLTDNLPLLAGSPNGIQKLRELILELAVRGKLVPQEPSDEPASELLKRIHVEKQRLLVESKARKQKELAADVLSEPPYGVPSGWEWQTLDSVLYVTGGVTLGRKLAGRKLLSKPYLRVANVQRGYLVLDQIKEVEIPEDEVEKYLLLNGDLLITEGGDWDKVGRTAIWRDELPECLHQNHVFRARAVTTEWEPRWAEIYLNSATAREYFAGSSKQTTNLASINMTQLRACAFPLPPLAEQHRIVAKVDELMALCDRLETRQADAASAHARLVRALLDSLTQASDAADFAASWQRLSAHFHTLLTTEASIDALKQTLLQLAVMGKLVPQDQNDEPASELLKRIAEEKARLVAEGYIKKPNLKSKSGVKEIDSFKLPERWAWVHFDELIDPELPISYGVLVPGPDIADGVPFVRIGDLSLESPPEKPEKSISQEVDSKYSRTRLQGGEVLMGVVGSIGKLGIAPPSWSGANIARAICRIAPISLTSKEYVVRLLQSNLMREQFLGDTRTLAQPTLNVGLIREASVPLPPLPEQHRIVAKLDELLSLCDQLKARLATARQLHERLAGALVEQAVA